MSASQIDCGKLATKAQAFVIDQVNPKFKLYNKPLLLAIVVLAFSLPITAGIWFYLSQCEQKTMMAPSDTIYDSLKHASASCVLQARQGPMDRIWPCNPEVDAEFVSKYWKPGAADSSQTVFVDLPCCSHLANPITREVLDRHYSGGVDPKPADYLLEHPCNDDNTYRVQQQLFEMCGRSIYGNVQTPILYVEYETCPNTFSTLGPALGFYGFIEVAVGGITVFVLQYFGIIKAGEEGHLGTMIKQLGGHVPEAPA